MIPEGWKYTELQEVAPVIDCKHKTPRYTPQGIPIISPGNLSWGPLNFDGCRTISVDDHADMMDHCTVEIGDVVFGRNQSVGVSSIVTNEQPFALGQDTVLIQPRAIDPSFLHQWLQSKQFSISISRLQGGSTFGRINLKDLRSLPVIVPKRQEARKIAVILATWDRAIATVEALIANARAQKKALMQSLLTGKHRLPGFEGEWLTSSFGEVLDLKIGGTPSRNDPELWDGWNETQNHWVAISDLTGKYLSRTKERISNLGVNRSNVKLLPVGTVVMSFKLSIGRKAILQVPAFTNEAICALIPKRHAGIDPLFIYHSLDAIDLEEMVDQAVKGKTLNKAKIAELRLRFPTHTEQAAIVSVLEGADRQVATLDAQLTALRQEKSALMQQLLTGKRRVKVAESEAA